MDDNDYHHRLGLATAIISECHKYRAYPIACIRYWIEPAVFLRQIHFFRDRNGSPIGYMTWALLAEDTEERLLHDPHVLFHLSEWNEGDRFWVMDLVLKYGNIRDVIHQARALFPHVSEAKALRRREDGSIRHVSRWVGTPSHRT